MTTACGDALSHQNRVAFRDAPIARGEFCRAVIQTTGQEAA
jgi:hypothetical protein